jgi:hypothetical protein
MSLTPSHRTGLCSVCGGFRETICSDAFSVTESAPGKYFSDTRFTTGKRYREYHGAVALAYSRRSFGRKRFLGGASAALWLNESAKLWSYTRGLDARSDKIGSAKMH